MFSTRLQSTRKFADWISVPVYWTRPAVGIKIVFDGSTVTQKYYFGIKYNSIAVNITLANRMCAKLCGQPKSWATSQAAVGEFLKLVQLASFAAAKYEEEMRR
jgi:hypothetical protein